MGDLLQERNLARLVKNKGFKFTDTFFPYTSGEIGPYYVSSEVVQANGGDYQEAIREMYNFMINELRSLPDVISGGESRDWVFSLPIATKMGSPHFMIYKDKKVKGGTNVQGKNVVHVADLSNEGSSPRDLWVPTIKEHGGNIEHIFFYVDRMEEGVRVMKELGLQSHAVVPLDANAWDYLQKQGVVSKEVYANLRERGTTKEQRDAWALKMLRTGAGIERLAEIAKTSPEKAQKIINHDAYSEVKSFFTGEEFKQLVDKIEK